MAFPHIEYIDTNAKAASLRKKIDYSSTILIILSCISYDSFQFPTELTSAPLVLLKYYVTHGHYIASVLFFCTTLFYSEVYYQEFKCSKIIEVSTLNKSKMELLTASKEQINSGKFLSKDFCSTYPEWELLAAQLKTLQKTAQSSPQLLLLSALNSKDGDSTFTSRQAVEFTKLNKCNADLIKNKQNTTLFIDDLHTFTPMLLSYFALSLSLLKLIIS